MNEIIPYKIFIFFIHLISIFRLIPYETFHQTAVLILKWTDFSQINVYKGRVFTETLKSKLSKCYPPVKIITHLTRRVTNSTLKTLIRHSLFLSFVLQLLPTT